MKPRRTPRYPRPFGDIADNGLTVPDYPDLPKRKRPNIFVRVTATLIVIGLLTASLLAVTGACWWLLRFFFI